MYNNSYYYYWVMPNEVNFFVEWTAKFSAEVTLIPAVSRPVSNKFHDLRKKHVFSRIVTQNLVS